MWRMEMRPTLPLLVTLIGLAAGEGLAQEVPEPSALELPAGAPVRLRTVASPDHWTRGFLTRADTDTIALVPEAAPPLGPNQLRLPRDTVTRLEVLTGKKKQWLPGLLIGAAAGVAMGLGEPVDPVGCEFDQYTFCSRGAALAAMTGTGAFLGALVGSLVKTDVWTPVPLDALGSPPAAGTRTGVGLRAVPGGLAAQLSVSF
jgi:hypothetical protein